MGVEYRLVKIRTGHAYDLGKTAMKPPLAAWKRLIRGLDPNRDALAWQAAMQPADRAMWSIGSTSDSCERTVLSDRWTPETLAAAITVACLREGAEDLAPRIADDLLRWAGREEVVLIPDTLDEEEVLERFGSSRRLRIVRRLEDAVIG